MQNNRMWQKGWHARKSERLKNEWLADILQRSHDQIVGSWMRFIRLDGGPHFALLNDKQLRRRLLPTIDKAIEVLRTGDVRSLSEYIGDLISQRVSEGYLLPELEQAIFGLQAVAIQAVNQASSEPEKRLEALQVLNQFHDLSALRIAEVYQRLQSEQQARLAALYELSTALSQTLDPQTAMQTAVQKAARAMRGAAAILLAREDGVPGEVTASFRMNPEVKAVVPELCRALGCVREQIENLGFRKWSCIAPDVRTSKPLGPWADLLATKKYLSMACIPLIAASRLLGALVVFQPKPHEFPAFETDFLRALAGHTATAIQTARLFEEAEGKRELSVLLQAAKLFTSSLDLDEVLGQVAELTMKTVGGDYIKVLLPDEARERLHIFASCSRPGEAENALERVVRVFEPQGLDIRRGAAGQAFTTGQALLIDDYSQFPGRIEELVDAAGSMLTVPIKLRGRIIGVLDAASLRKGVFTRDNLSLAMGVADQAAIAIENARLYGREKNIAETFQRSFLPETLPSIEGYSLAISYRAALTEAEVGGDFYDVFPVDSDRTAILVADVSGKGLSAAAYTAMGKYMIRAYAAENPSPGWVLEELNRAILKYVGSGMFITAFYGVLDSKQNELSYASAGHNQPMLYKKRQDYVTLLDVTGPGAGVIREAKYGERRMSLDPGDMLLVYTDGAINVRREGKLLDVEGLEDLFRANVSLPAKETVDNILSGVLEYGEGRLEDDVALMVLKNEHSISSET